MEFLHSLTTGNSILISSLILAVAYIFIASEKIPKMTVALIGGGLTILLGLVEAEKGVNYFINFIDFNVIFLLVSMMILVNITSKSGVFNWIANEFLKLTKGHPIAILFALGSFTAVISAFLDNVTTVILIMPVTFVIAKQLKTNVLPYLITEIFASNIGGTATLIGDPPNIIIGTAADLSFTDFLVILSPIVFIILLTILILMTFIFKKELKSTPERMEAIKNLDNTNTITNYHLMLRSTIILILVIISFVMHDITHIPAYLSAMIGASILLLFEKPTEILKEIEWNTIFFFIGLFIIIGGLEASGGITLMAQWILKITNDSQMSASMLILWASGIISGVIDNIPYTATMTPMILEIQKVMGTEYANPLWWSLSLGACLGGNMTIIGAAANVIVAETARQNGFPIKFMKFFKYGVLTTIISLALSTIYICFKFFA